MQDVFDAFLSAQRGRFALFLPVFMAGGTLAYFDLAAEPGLAWPCASLACAIASAALVWRWTIPRALALAAVFACAGFALAAMATARAPAWTSLPRHAAILTGRVTQLDILPEGRRVTLAAPSLDGAPPLARALRVRLRSSDPTSVAPGDTIRVRALLRPPPPPDYPGGWDTQREAYFSSLGGYGFAIGGASVIASAQGNAWTRLRAGIAARLLAGLPGTKGAVAATLLTGTGSAIPPADRAAFQDSGLAHLLAVAGLHIGIVMTLAFGATRFALAAWERAALTWPAKQIAALASLGAGLFYLALTGAHVPILRSFAMAALVTAGVLTGRRAVSMRGLALAALALMLISPASVIGVSFQMSFASVLTLIAGYEIARPALAGVGAGSWWRPAALYVGGLVLTSLLAGTASLPFAMYHFGRATLYYVPANMLAVPLTALWVMPWGLASLALMPLGLERLALVPMGWGLQALIAIAHTVAAWPEAAIDVPRMPGGGLALVALGLVLCGIWRGRLRLCGLLPIALGLCAPLVIPQPDMLVGPEARLIALREPGRILVERASGVSAFEAAAPGRLWGSLPTKPLGGQPGIACDAAACVAQLAGLAVRIVRTPDGMDCAAALIVSPLWLRESCPNAAILDHARALRDGAAEIRFAKGEPLVTTDRAWRGDRPWVLLARPTLPMAQAE